MAMTNIQMEREGDILKISIDLAQTHGPSKSGATLKVASTGGFIPVPGDEKIILSLNCNKPRE